MAANSTKPKLLVIVGPTASGKSALAMQIARQLSGEIIAADSRTIYRGVDIGTDKPTRDDQLSIPHHLLDLIEPNKRFTVAEFKKAANRAIAEIQAKGKLPIMVGGSGLYIDSVIFDFKFGPRNMKLRTKLETMSPPELIKYALVNDISLGGIEPTNKRHVIRAIERGGIIEQSLKPRPDCLIVGLSLPNDILIQRISSRVDDMMAKGFINEAAGLSAKYGWDNQAASIYKMVRGHLNGDETERSIKDELVKKHKNLAKRQRTWLKRNPYIHWFDNNLDAEHFILGALNTKVIVLDSNLLQ